jgi:hypothetical protein
VATFSSPDTVVRVVRVAPTAAEFFFSSTLTGIPSAPERGGYTLAGNSPSVAGAGSTPQSIIFTYPSVAVGNSWNSPNQATTGFDAFPLVSNSGLVV